MPLLIDYSFEIPTLDKVGVPVSTFIFNEFDEKGLELGQARLTGEDNYDYVDRLLDANANPGNSTYLGLVNDITRSLGLKFFQPLEISLKPAYSDLPYPAVVIDGPLIYLYEDFSVGQKVVDLVIDRFDQYKAAPELEDTLTEPAWTIEELRDYIDAHSTVFTATVLLPEHNLTSAMTILNGSSLTTVPAESVDVTNTYEFLNQKLLKGSVSFVDRTTYSTEKSTFPDVLEPGDYSINYAEGIVRSFEPPRSSNRVSYQFNTMPFTPKASPVVIHDVQSESFKRKMFVQKKDDFLDNYNTLPTSYGAEIINEILSVYPEYYGK